MDLIKSTKQLFLKYFAPSNRREKMFLTYAVIFTIVATLTIVLTTSFGPQIVLLFSSWFVLAQIAIKCEAGRTEERDSSLKIIYATAVIYPFIEILIKYFIFSNAIPYSYYWVNRIEHGLFSALITYFMYFPMREALSATRSQFTTMLSTIAYVNMLGVFNEFLEYFIRVYNHLPLTKYYADTMNDLLVNFIFSVIMGLFIYFLNKDQNARSTSDNKQIRQ